VSSLANPVGPLPDGVYWRRRLVVLGVAALLVIGLVWACSPEGDQTPTSTPATATPSTSAPATTSEPAPTTAAPTTARASSTPGGPCVEDDIEVTATVADAQYPVGGPVPIRFVVRSTADDPCTRDVGAAENTVTIRSEDRRIWSSDDCTPGGDPDVRTLSPDEPYAVTVTWQGDVSRPGCESPRPQAPPGDYSVVGRNGGVTGSADSFTLG
jgi:hypothetical protein